VKQHDLSSMEQSILSSLKGGGNKIFDARAHLGAVLSLKDLGFIENVVNDTRAGRHSALWKITQEGYKHLILSAPQPQSYRLWHVTVVAIADLHNGDENPLPAIEFDAEHDDPEALREATNQVLDTRKYIVNAVTVSEES
jgi:hypothetical protein